MPKKSKIICLNDGRIYDTISAASQAAGVNKSSMSRHLSGEIRTIRGMIYRHYTDDIADLNPEELLQLRKRELNAAYGITLRGGEQGG